MIKTRTWIIIIAVTAAVAAAAAIAVRFFLPAGTTAEIVKDGKVLYRIDLDRVTEEYKIEIGDEDGDRNTVTVRPGMIAVTAADCPDKICVATGWASGERPYPIVCMPHRLTVRITSGDAGADAEAR